MILTSAPVAASQYLIFGVILVVIAVRLVMRMRPQPVNTTRILGTGGVIAALVLVSFASTLGHVGSDWLTWALLPVFTAAGVGLGAALVRTVRFWVPEGDHRPWMQGGLLFAVILVVTIVLRVGVTIISNPGEFSGQAAPAGTPTLLEVVSADLLWLSLGLWGARSLLIYRRARALLAPR